MKKIGAGLLAGSLLLMWKAEWGFAYAFLIAAGILDLILVYKHKETISQWVQDLFDKKIDIGIIAAISVLTLLCFGVSYFLFMLIGFLICHLFADGND